MRHSISIFFILLIVLIQAQPNVDSSKLVLLRNVVNTLAHDSMKGRATGSLEETKALAFLKSNILSNTSKKLEVQPFYIQQSGKTKLKTKNAYCFIDNKSKHTVLISAHYDHIGMGGLLSQSLKSNEVHNGADDNASGVAIILSLLKDLALIKNTKVNYLFVFYSGHEIGLYGSQAFYNTFIKKEKKWTIDWVLNLDMVGRLDADERKLKCAKSLQFDSLITKPMDTAFGLNLRVVEENLLEQLDTKVFYENKIPCINFSTGQHNDYHKTSDDAHYINFEGMVVIEKYLMQLLLSYKAR
jgi:Zn-dependent M28 family amino/carboxypeptidase